MLKIFENLNKFKMTMLRKGDLDVADRQIDKYSHKYRQYGCIYPSHGYTALVADEICQKYQAILACWSSLGTYRCM